MSPRYYFISAVIFLGLAVSLAGSNIENGRSLFGVFGIGVLINIIAAIIYFTYGIYLKKKNAKGEAVGDERQAEINLRSTWFAFWITFLLICGFWTYDMVVNMLEGKKYFFMSRSLIIITSMVVLFFAAKFYNDRKLS